MLMEPGKGMPASKPAHPSPPYPMGSRGRNRRWLAKKPEEGHSRNPVLADPRAGSQLGPALLTESHLNDSFPPGAGPPGTIILSLKSAVAGPGHRPFWRVTWPDRDAFRAPQSAPLPLQPAAGPCAELSSGTGAALL